MGQTQAKAPRTEASPARRGSLVRRTLVRLAAIIGVALAIGSGLHHLAGKVDAEDRPPAGFVQGMAQGALMPLALPNLLVGRDVPIYAARNTGRFYKLGYTVGVNGCGAIFFGLLYWRLQRLRRRLENRGAADS